MLLAELQVMLPGLFWDEDTRKKYIFSSFFSYVFKNLPNNLKYSTNDIFFKIIYIARYDADILSYVIYHLMQV